MARDDRSYTIGVTGKFYTITWRDKLRGSNGKMEIRDPQVRLSKETKWTLKALVREHGICFALAAVADAQKGIKAGSPRVTHTDVDTEELGL